MGVCTGGQLFIIIGLYSLVITAIPTGSDIDASIAKLINGIDGPPTTQATAGDPLGAPATPKGPSDIYRQGGGGSVTNQQNQPPSQQQQLQPPSQQQLQPPSQSQLPPSPSPSPSLSQLQSQLPPSQSQLQSQLPPSQSQLPQSQLPPSQSQLPQSQLPPSPSQSQLPPPQSPPPPSPQSQLPPSQSQLPPPQSQLPPPQSQLPPSQSQLPPPQSQPQQPPVQQQPSLFQHSPSQMQQQPPPPQQQPQQPQGFPPVMPHQSKFQPSGPTLTFVNGTAIGKSLVFKNLDSIPSIATNECQIFLGIPYATSPTDQLRFKAPKPSSRWSAPLDATKFKAACTQDQKALPRSPSISEDCLHVNIFKPAVSTTVPIVVWIHGGAFVSGSATAFSPTTACRQVVVNTLTVVTVNYRLGVFGFAAHENLSTDDTNVGLRDIALAVRWVQENAVALGSQPDQIVLVGHGAGASLVSLLLDSGLINTPSIKGAILMSGSGQAPWAVTKSSRQSMKNLMKEFNCQTLDCMKKIDASKLSDKSSKFWSPYLDNSTILPPDARRSILKRSDNQPFPVIVGFTLQEGTALAVKKLAPVNGHPLKEKITRSLVDLTGEPREQVERRYLYDRAVPIDFFETIFDFVDALSDAYSDTLFKLPLIREATRRTQQQSSNVYIYAIRNDLPLPGNVLPGYKASYHGSDLDLFWFPYAKQSRVNLLGAFLQVILHQEDNLPWRPWSPQAPVILQVTPFGGQFVTYRPNDPVSSSYNQTYYNTTSPKYGAAGMSWTSSPQRKFTLINATPFPISFNRKKIQVSTVSTTSASSTEPTSSSSTTATRTSTTANPTTATAPPSSSAPPPTASVNKTANITNVTDSAPSRDISASPTNSTFQTSTKSNSATRSNGSSSETNTVVTSGTQDSLVWVLLGLAVLFLFLFLVTVGGCAAWNRQSYHPHPNRRSRHQGAKVRTGQQRVPPPVAPLDSSNDSTPQPQPVHQPRSHKDISESGKQTGRRQTPHQTGGGGQSNIVTNAHRRPRQPPPSLPPLLCKDTKRN